MLIMGCTNTIERVVTKTEIVCAGQIVTWDSSVDVLSTQTKKEILSNNKAYEACRETIRSKAP